MKQRDHISGDIYLDTHRGQEPELSWEAFADSKTTQVEHIWARATQWLGDKKTAHEKNVHRLGNLTVTHFNQALGKKPFKEKRKIYKKSGLLIENELQHHRVWNLDKVKRREKKLVEFLMRRWAVPSADDDEEQSV